MRVALLLYGQPRFVDDNIAFESHKEAFLDKYPVDTYCHMWYNENGDYGEISSWTTKFRVPIDAPEIVKRNYNPISMIVEKPYSRDIPEKIETIFRENYKNHFLYAPQNFPNMISQLRTIERVCELAPKTYDLYILTRYDVIISSVPPLDKLRKDRIYIPLVYADRMSNAHFKDTINIFGSKFLDPSPFAGLADKLLSDEKFLVSAKMPTPEMFKFLSIKDRYGAEVIEAIKIENSWLRKNEEGERVPFTMLSR